MYNYFIETNNWSDSLFGDTLDYSEYSFETRTVRDWLQGMKAYHGSNPNELRMHIDSMFTHINHNTNAALTSEGGPMCSGVYSRDTPTQLDVDRATVLKLELEAALAILEDNSSKAESLMKDAVDLEQATSYNYGPPAIVKPSSEFYAEWLLKQGRTEEAVSQLKMVLKRAPGRRIAEKILSGLEV